MDRTYARLAATTLLIVLAAGETVSASPNLYWGIIGASDFSESPTSVGDVADQYKRADTTDLSGGVEFEFAFNSIGFGGRFQSRFSQQEIDDTEVLASEDWWMDWESDGFVRYHLFGAGSFIDPYASLGFGTAGRYRMNDEAYWDEESEDWVRYADSDSDYEPLAALSVYQYAGVGGQLNMGNLSIGGGLNYIFANQDADSDDAIGVYPMETFEVYVYGGISFGNR